MKRSRIYSVVSVCLLLSLNLFAQEKPDLQKLIPRKRIHVSLRDIVNKLEVFAGANSSLNHGNKFIDNHYSPYFKNNRELKMGYSFGVGVSPVVNKRLEILLRVSWDQTGTKAKFTTKPKDTSATHNLIQSVESTYTYQYLTLSIIPKINFGKQGKCALLVGGYYGKIQSIKGHFVQDNLSKNYHIFSEASFNGRFIYGVDSQNGGITSFGTASSTTSIQNDDYGLVVGFSYQAWQKNKHSLSIQLIDNFGLQNINKSFGSFLPIPPELNNSLCLLINYSFIRNIPHKY
ncbi:MAG: hypothetical protein JST43_04380 [Bacteroidetes bacterium]|nr:hypothetical protein [Bacteroidota bacterium]MBS1539941.1 hypothetical protein [Bacteroidota bacterium]